jgi:tetratricopeptide (TPR) repeat protein
VARLFFCVLYFGLSSSIWAQAGNLTLKLDNSKPVKLDYSSNSWNKNPGVAESHFLLLRDAGTGKMARIVLQETGPNTGEFEGSYQISFRNNTDILPEIYVVPEALMENADSLKKIDALIRDGTLLRKPFFLRQEARSQALSVFDSREQALQAFDLYKRNGPSISQSTLNAQRVAMAVGEKAGANLLAQKNLGERARIEAEELAKREAQAKIQAALNAEEKFKRAAQAKVIADKAMELYKKEMFKEAEVEFAKATELDPDNRGYYFQYGVTLYKNEKYNHALVVLPKAGGPDVNTLERDYFIALCHMKLKENKTAIAEFNAIKEKEDKSLSPSAAFYAGIIEFQSENYDPAQAQFEYVLDKSSDSKLDRQAEAYIEQIANIKVFLKNKAKKFLYTFSLGLSYDSNVLNQANSGSATDVAGYRIPVGLSLEYRPVYSETHEFSSLLALSNTTSYNTKFGNSATLQQADALTANLSLPYKYKGQAFKKGYQMTVYPAYETTAMNVDPLKSGPIDNREIIVNSMILHNDNTFVMSEDWFATYSFDYRSDASKIVVASDDDSQTATKIALTTSQVFFKDKKKTVAWSGDGGISLNQAIGINQRYQRLDLGITYLTPWYANTSATVRFAAYTSKYPVATVSRTDNNLGLTLALSKALNEKWSTNVGATYNNNMSNVDSSKYTKYTISTGLSYAGDF